MKGKAQAPAGGGIWLSPASVAPCGGSALVVLTVHGLTLVATSCRPLRGLGYHQVLRVDQKADFCFRLLPKEHIAAVPLQVSWQRQEASWLVDRFPVMETDQLLHFSFSRPEQPFGHTN